MDIEKDVEKIRYNAIIQRYYSACDESNRYYSSWGALILVGLLTLGVTKGGIEGVTFGVWLLAVACLVANCASLLYGAWTVEKQNERELLNFFEQLPDTDRDNKERQQVYLISRIQKITFVAGVFFSILLVIAIM